MGARVAQFKPGASCPASQPTVTFLRSRPRSEPRTEVVKALRQPFEKSAEVHLLPGEGVPLCRLVSPLAHTVELGRIGRPEREQDFDVAPRIVKLHPQAVFVELAVCSVASSVR